MTPESTPFATLQLAVKEEGGEPQLCGVSARKPAFVTTMPPEASYVRGNSGGTNKNVANTCVTYAQLGGRAVATTMPLGSTLCATQHHAKQMRRV